MSKLVPLNGYIILKPYEESEVFAGNIIIPDTGKEKPAMGTVISVSPFYNFQADKFVDIDIKEGDLLVIPRVGSQRITVHGEEFYICKTVEVIGKIEN